MIISIKEILDLFIQNIKRGCIRQIFMGGDTFEGVQKLTNQEYQQYVPEILSALQSIYIKAQPYIALPQKQIHGDIDFLMILTPGAKQQEIIDILKMERYKINNNNTINSVYKDKQVDFCFVQNQSQFAMERFYKAYSGMGAFFGSFLPSKEIKLSDKGLYALGYWKHIKFQYLITNSVPQILQFYGVSYEKFTQGFEKREGLFEFMLECKFLNIDKFIKQDTKHAAKVTKFLIEYILGKNIKQEKEICIYANPKDQTLEYFGKKQQFYQQFEQTVKNVERKQALGKKFNATHIMSKFGITAKKVNKWKKLFHSSFEGQQAYDNFIESHTLEEILEKFDFELGNKIKDEQMEKKQKSESDNASETKSHKSQNFGAEKKVEEQQIMKQKDE